MDKPENIDRALLGLCAAVWLAVIGVSVAATVALVGLGSGHANQPEPNANTPWVLYVVIGISAVVILASIPLLLRARRVSLHEPPTREPAAAPRAEPPAPRGRIAPEPATEKLRVFGTVADPAHRDRLTERLTDERSRFLGGPSTEFVDRVWLRFITTMATAIGLATLAVGIAAYLLADHSDGMAWAALVVAGLITAAMPAIPWWHLRRLDGGAFG
jgi:NhaP-type Na+/H+ or K+/H+ antiporter